MAFNSAILQPKRSPTYRSLREIILPQGVTMRKAFVLFAGFLLLLAAVGGCQTSVPTFGRDTIMPALGFSAVPGQYEPDLSDSDDE
jgi:hypothetical protein